MPPLMTTSSPLQTRSPRLRASSLIVGDVAAHGRGVQSCVPAVCRCESIGSGQVASFLATSSNYDDDDSALGQHVMQVDSFCMPLDMISKADDEVSLPDPYLTPMQRGKKYPVSFSTPITVPLDLSLDHSNSSDNTEPSMISRSLGSFVMPSVATAKSLGGSFSLDWNTIVKVATSGKKRALRSKFTLLPQFLELPVIFGGVRETEEVSVPSDEDDDVDTGDNDSLTDDEADDEAVQAQAAAIRKARQAQALVQHWTVRVEYAQQYRPALPQARTLVQLAHAQRRAHDYENAIATLQQARRLYETLKLKAFAAMDERSRCHNVALAHVHDQLGLARCAVRQFDVALQHYTTAFTMLVQELGSWHVDAVQALSHVAYAHTKLRQYGAAAQCYWEVLHVKRAIFGTRHASVAVTCHELGTICLKRAQLDEARQWYEHAWCVYEAALPSHKLYKNPAVLKLQHDKKQLERLEQMVTGRGGGGKK